MTTAERNTFEIAGRPIGPGHPPYVVAELSANHNGDLGRALAVVEMAKDAGADAVKLQTYTADTMTIDHDSPEFRISGGLWDGRSLHELYEEAHTPWDWHEALFDKARDVGITMFSAPFDSTAVDFLETLNVPAYKIASFEAVDLPLIARVAATGKPMIISTGMANHDEIGEAVQTARDAGNQNIVLLHCVSGYPAPPGDSNLRTIADIAEQFDVVVGLSDHTLGTAVSVAGVSLGATLIEKHVTLSREDRGPDSSFSLEPDELRLLVSSCREAWEALGRIDYERKESETGNAVFRRSLYVVQDIAAGETLTDAHVRSIRPGFGLAPKHLPDVLGRRARKSISRGTAMSWDLVE
ncbi:MAG: pseudaminic acid synthase [Rhodospirillaceae bacterium]|jgi:pseudaminic acid synthase|nr:pseudaminic acid synthase [Rhodospirillaceae bacterium]MBT7360406.1 pseudaminic acid synthase [Rhodospirillaceae bacterium]